MELDKPENIYKEYQEKVKPEIEKGDYDKALTQMTGLACILEDQFIRNNLTQTPITHLASTSFNARELCENLEKRDTEGIKESARKFEVYLKQYIMRLNALVES